MMERPQVHSRLNLIIHESNKIQDIQDIYHFFEEDTVTPLRQLRNGIFNNEVKSWNHFKRSV